MNELEQIDPNDFIEWKKHQKILEELKHELNILHHSSYYVESLYDRLNLSGH